MPLRSQLFKDDPKLEAAATSDPAHIKQGDSGEHVRKIQTALIQLDGAKIAADGQYGPATAAAVLAYKRKRNIINTSYQTQADNIVGKMTMASLDDELLALELRPQGPLQIVPLSNATRRPFRTAAVQRAISVPPLPQLNFAIGAGGVGAPRVLPVPNPPDPNSNIVLSLKANQTGKIQVLNAAPPDGNLFVDVDVKQRLPLIAIKNPAPLTGTSLRVPVTNASQTFEIKSGPELGISKLTVTTAPGADGRSEQQSIEVVVVKHFGRPDFFPGVAHNHDPNLLTKDAKLRWKEIQKHPNNKHGKDPDSTMYAGFATSACQKNPSPEKCVDSIMNGAMATFIWGGSSLGKLHAQWYLDGTGADFIEDANITRWLRLDPGIRRRLIKAIFPKLKQPVVSGHFTFGQGEYGDGPSNIIEHKPSDDFRLAFGSIDRVDYAVDFSRDIVSVWFQDRYEWHPFYPKFYDVQGGTKEFPHAGDGPRPTNTIHAAMLEMKDRKFDPDLGPLPKAQDYWMKGIGEIKLNDLINPNFL